MNFFSKNHWTEETFTQVIQQKNMTALLEKKSPSKNNFYYLIDKTFNMKKTLSIGFILSDYSFLPYLSIKENLFIGTSIKEKQKKIILNYYMQFIGLDESILIKDKSDITFFEYIKLQIIHLLLTEKNVLIMDNVFSKLTVYQRQELLRLLQKIAKNNNKAIFIVTDDSKIAKSSYIDILIDAG